MGSQIYDFNKLKKKKKSDLCPTLSLVGAQIFDFNKLKKKTIKKNIRSVSDPQSVGAQMNNFNKLKKKKQ